MINLAFLNHSDHLVRSVDDEILKGVKISPIVEGIKELDAIAPVNHVTGDRMNVLDLLGIVLSPDRKDLLKKFIMDVPASRALTQLDDESAIQLLRDKTSSGYPADDDAFAMQMASIAEIALPAIRQMAAKHSADSNDTISFHSGDAPASE